MKKNEIIKLKRIFKKTTNENKKLPAVANLEEKQEKLICLFL